jgi:hypothetical protein
MSFRTVGFTVGYADLYKRPPKESGADLKKRLPSEVERKPESSSWAVILILDPGSCPGPDSGFAGMTIFNEIIEIQPFLRSKFVDE